MTWRTMGTAIEEKGVTAADSVQMLIDSWALMTGRFEGHSFVNDHGVVSTFANRPLPFLNLSTLDRPSPVLADFRRSLALARARASDCCHPSLLALCGDWSPEGYEDVAAEAGWLRSMSLAGMATDCLRPARRPGPVLDFRLVDGPEAGLDLGLVNALAYGMPPKSFDCMREMPLWGTGAFGVVGYDEGRPVTGAATFAVGETIYVAMVASAPGLHGRGYGEAAMRRAIDHAEQAVGRKRIWLHATEVGFPLYRAMGFEGGPAMVMFHLASPGPEA